MYYYVQHTFFIEIYQYPHNMYVKYYIVAIILLQQCVDYIDDLLSEKKIYENQIKFKSTNLYVLIEIQLNVTALNFIYNQT